MPKFWRRRTLRIYRVKQLSNQLKLWIQVALQPTWEIDTAYRGNTLRAKGLMIPTQEGPISPTTGTTKIIITPCQTLKATTKESKASASRTGSAATAIRWSIIRKCGLNQQKSGTMRIRTFQKWTIKCRIRGTKITKWRIIHLSTNKVPFQTVARPKSIHPGLTTRGKCKALTTATSTSSWVRDPSSGNAAMKTWKWMTMRNKSPRVLAVGIIRTYTVVATLKALIIEYPNIGKNKAQRLFLSQKRINPDSMKMKKCQTSMVLDKVNKMAKFKIATISWTKYRRFRSIFKSNLREVSDWRSRRKYRVKMRQIMHMSLNFWQLNVS